MNTRLGILGILGIWATMAMMPIAELLSASPYQLLALRGLPGVVVLGALAVIRKDLRIQWPDLMTSLTSVMFVVACVGLFSAIKEWGTNLSAVLLDMAVFVNFTLAIVRGERIGRPVMLAFACAIVGSALALRVWDTAHLDVAGLLWSLLALVANGLCIEFGTKMRQDFPTRVFWFSAALVAAGVVLSIGEPWQLQGKILPALWFGVTTGLLNFLCAFLAFKNLKAIWTGTLVLGVTPSILLGSLLITGRVLYPDQLLGIALTLVAVGCLGSYLAMRQPAKQYAT